MTAGYGTPVASTFTLVDPDQVARNYRGEVRQGCSAASMHRLIAAVNCVAARCPRVLFFKLLPGQNASGTGWLLRWLVPDYVQNASEHEFRALEYLRAVDPATGPGYWTRLDSSLAEDTTCKGGEYAATAPTWFSAARYFGGRATWARDGAKRPPTDSVVDEGIICKNGHLLGGLIVQDVPLSLLDVSDHQAFHSLITRGDPVLGGHALEKLASVLHDVRSSNLPVVVSWAAVGSGATFAATTAANDTDEYGCHITDDAAYRNVLGPLLSVTRSWATYGANTPGWQYHAYRCGVGDPATAAGAKIKVNCYVLASADTEDATVRFEGPTSIASNSTTITVTTAGGLAWYGGTSNSVYLDTTVDNDDATASRAKIDVCGKAGSGGDLWIYGLFAHVTYA